MSLKEVGCRMLEIEHHRAKRRAAEPGADSGVSRASGEIEFDAANRREVYDDRMNVFDCCWFRTLRLRK
jgi:hypothetical protein